MARLTKKQKFIELLNTIDFNNLSKHKELCSLYHNIVIEQGTFNSKDTIKDNYPYIATYPEDLLIVAEIIKLYNKLYRTTKKYKSFVDLGHGNGLTLAFLKTLLKNTESCFFDYYGIDLNPLKENSRSIKADLLTYNKYHEYDILYAYNPINNIDKMLELIDKVIEDMESNTIFIFNRAIGLDSLLIRNFIPIPDTRLLIYIKK